MDDKHSLVLAANRDEFLDRNSLAMDFWQDNPQILAGRDLEAGGTWLGLNRQGRWAAVTNFRGSQSNPQYPRSRGELVANFLTSSMSAREYLGKVAKESSCYRGFNLLLGAQQEVFYLGNRSGQSDLVPLQPGYYGLSNDVLETPWPKVELGKSKLEQVVRRSTNLEHSNIFELLGDRSRPDVNDLPDTGVGLAKEKLLSSMFIESPSYGTRCSTSMMLGFGGQIRVAEKSYPNGSVKQYELKV